VSLLGIDVGTTTCKAGAFCESGECLAYASREYPTLRPRHGWTELDSRLVWKCVSECIAAVAAQTGHDPIKALCVSSMGEAMTPVSKEREILGRCILSSDIRGTEYMARLRQDIPQETFYAINPNILGPQYSLPKILWLKEQEPASYDSADKFLLWGDLVGYMLGGEAVTSFSHANRTLLFDIRQEDWSGRLLDWSAVDRAKLPRPVASGTIAGTVSDAVARQLNLPRGVAIVVGGHDQCCNSLGAGIYEAGKAVCGIGTFECITPTYDHIPDAGPMLRYGLNVEHHVLPRLFVSFIYNQGGTLVRWFRDTFARGECERLKPGQDIYDALAAEMPADPTGLFVLPYFEPTGPPQFVVDASGVIVGLKTSTTRGDILKSIMESVTFYFAESVRALEAMGIRTTEFVATGGGSKSDRWLQIKADIFGVPFVRPCITEGSVLGAAMVAGLSVGCLSSPSEAASRFVKRERVFEPDPERHRWYEQKQGAYSELFPALRDFLARLEQHESHRASGN